MVDICNKIYHQAYYPMVWQLLNNSWYAYQEALLALVWFGLTTTISVHFQSRTLLQRKYYYQMMMCPGILFLTERLPSQRALEEIGRSQRTGRIFTRSLKANIYCWITRARCLYKSNYAGYITRGVPHETREKYLRTAERCTTYIRHRFSE